MMGSKMFLPPLRPFFMFILLERDYIAQIVGQYCKIAGGH